MNPIIDKIRRALKENIDETTQRSSQSFFKERIKYYGVNTALVSKISKEYFAVLRDKTKKEFFHLCEELWQSGYIEESFVACHWSYYVPGEIFGETVYTYVENGLS